VGTTSELLLERVRQATEDEYTIDGELGRGGMAAVFLARDKALDRRVAIKVMLPDLVDVEGIQDRFVIEAKTAAKLDHPGIVTVYSVKQRAGLLFIVMKYVEGRTLEGVLDNQKKLDASVVTSIVGRVAEALYFAHGEGIVHRDVKPSNIIIDKKGRPIVTDFGIAKVMSARSITVTGSVLGTPTYMSPEQCRGLAATAASDQYALGVMMYEMLTGAVPFTGTIFELINAHCNDEPTPLAQAVPGIDAALAETVTRMMAKSPPDRWPSLADVAKRLMSSAPAHRRSSSEVEASIASFAEGAEAISPPKTRGGVDVSGAATELATTPAPGLVVSPDAPTIEVGETLQLRVSEASGASLAGVRMTWRSEDPTIATVDDSGLVTGRSVGFAKITAAAGAAVGRVPVTVKVPVVNTLVVTPQNPEIVVGSEIQFIATVLDARGTTLVGQPIMWQCSDGSVCAMSEGGRAIGIAPGKATITAICGEARATAQARVRLPHVERVVVDPGEVSIEAEETRRLSAVVYGVADRKLTGRKVTWHSMVPTVVTVDAEGTLKGISAGTAAVYATCEDKKGLVSVSVRSQPVVAVRIQPAQLKIEVGRSLQLKGVGEDRRGRPVTDSGLEWQSDDNQIALIDASGKVHAVKEGRTLVRAIAGEAASTIDVTVIPRAVAQVRIEPHQPKLAAGEFMTIDATVLDAEGGVLAGRKVAWTSDNESVVTISATGVCEAKKAGSVRITAVCENARATTKLNATAAPAVAPAPAAAAPAVAAAAVAAADQQTEVMERHVRRPAEPPASPLAPPPSTQAPAKRKSSRAVPITIALVVIGAIGVWAATRGSGAGTPPVTSPAPVTTPADPSTTQQTPPVQQNPATPSTQRPNDVAGRAGQGTKVPVTTPSQNPATGQKQGTEQKQITPPNQKQAPPVEQKQPPVEQKQPPVEQKQPPVEQKQPPVEQKQPPVEQKQPPPVEQKQQPVTLTPPPVTRPADPNDAARAAMCTNPEPPVGLLTGALGADPAARIRTLYQAKDATDGKMKSSILDQLKDAPKVKTTVRTLRPEPAGAVCNWLMAVEFNWNNFVSAARNLRLELRLQLDLVDGAPRVKEIFGAVKK
jgi:serine/threonine-protein kinase